MSDEERCGHPREDEDPCASSIGLCDDCGRCWQHCAHVDEHRRQEARRRGGQSRARQRKTYDGVDAPWKLKTVHDAKDWLERIGRLVLQNEISAKQAHSACRAVECWLDAEKDAVAMDELEELREKVDALKNREEMQAV